MFDVIYVLHFSCKFQLAVNLNGWMDDLTAFSFIFKYAG